MPFGTSRDKRRAQDAQGARRRSAHGRDAAGALARPSTSRTIHKPKGHSPGGKGKPSRRRRAPTAPSPGRRGRWSLYASAMADTDAFDPLETPRCPIHPTQRLVDVGTAPDGRDARWECPVDGCIYLQLA